MGGSTIFGHDPLKYIQRHVIPVSYGVKSHIIYNPSIHAGLEYRLIPHGTGFVIRDCYDAIVTPGEVVALDESLSLESIYHMHQTQGKFVSKSIVKTVEFSLKII